MTTKTVTVTMEVEVTVDETKFDPQFMCDFRKDMYPSFKTLDDHIMFLAKCAAQGMNMRNLEGYGDAVADFGVTVECESVSVSIES